MQKIDDAYSSVVNLDYFPVAVSELPIIDGTRATPEQFLEHIRKGINDFIDPFYSEFTPYHWYGVDDTQLWNSNNPLGAVVAVDIAGLEDASVIVSHSSSDKWIFTTIYDPRFGEHPVSGNRDFGYITNPDGSYTFYMRGVDRLTSWDATLLQVIPQFFGGAGIPFSQADALWTSFQDKVSDFVNSNGGAATVDQIQIVRPYWSDIEDVVNGEKPLSTLNSDCE